MHKKIMLPFMLFVISVCVLSYVWNRFCFAEELYSQNQLMVSKINRIKIDDIQVIKTAEKLFAPKSKSLKNDIKLIDSEKLIQSLKIQKDQIEIIMIAYNDKHIEKLITDLYLKLNGVVNFQDIRLIKQNDKIKAKIVFIVKYFDNEELQKSIVVYPQKNTTTHEHLFRTIQRHQLLATIENKLAFIDNAWFKIGDVIDGDTIINITQYNISIKNQYETNNIHIGESW